MFVALKKGHMLDGIMWFTCNNNYKANSGQKYYFSLDMR